MKKFLKELMITILLCIAIVLVLAIIFYDYIPINKTIPDPVNYTIPESLSEVKEELKNSVQNEEEKIIITYEIDESDLSGYKKQGSYKEGKVDPFSITDTTGSTTNNDLNTINSSNTTDTNDEQENTDSTGTFFENGGMK